MSPTNYKGKKKLLKEIPITTFWLELVTSNVFMAYSWFGDKFCLDISKAKVFTWATRAIWEWLNEPEKWVWTTWRTSKTSLFSSHNRIEQKKNDNWVTRYLSWFICLLFQSLYLRRDYHFLIYDCCLVGLQLYEYFLKDLFPFDMNQKFMVKLKDRICILFFCHNHSHSHSHSALCNVYPVALDSTRR